ncbi:MAG: hypothetical protein V4631_03145 [Pseudomonadota bacterium]
MSRFAALLCGLVLTALLSACGGGGGQVGLPTGTALFTNAPAGVTLAAGAASSYTVGGGNPLYTVSSSNIDVARATVSGTSFTITAVGAGTATISVTDAVGAAVQVPVTVTGVIGPPAIPPGSLFTTAGGSVAVAVGANATYGIGGGTPGYAVSSSNAGVATATLSGTNFTVRGIAAGSANVVITDATGTALTLSVTVGSIPTPVLLFTTAPNAVTLAVGTAGGYTIGGGKPAYAVSSSNAGVASVALSGTTFTITGVAAGTAQVVVVDADGERLEIAVTVGTSGTATALFTTAPDDVRIAVGATATYAIGGGTPVYMVSSSNTAIARVAINGSSFIITGVASGTAQVAVFDAKGDSEKIVVTVGAGSTTTSLYTSATSSLVLATGVTESFTIGGGTSPYTVSSSNTGVATASVNGSNFSVTGVASGTAQVAITDATGSALSITVTVGSGSAQTALFTTAPGSVTVAVGASGAYMVGGGTAPYAASTSNAAVASAAINGVNLLITGNGPGTANVNVVDASGATVLIAVTVGSGTTTALYTTAPPAITLAVGSPGVYAVGGGAGGYVATTSNASAATASMSGTTLTVTPVTAGTATISVFDMNGATVGFDVTVTQVQPGAITVLPGAATGNVGDSLVLLVSGGSPGYTITMSNTSIATVSPSTVAASGGSFTLNLLNVGDTVATIVDAAGKSLTVPVSVEQISTVLRLSPSALTVGENYNGAIALNIFGGTGPYRAFTSDETLSSVSVSGSIMTVAVGSSNNRCINPITDSGTYIPNGTFDVTVTAVDSLGASATSVLTIKDNGAGLNLGCP